MKAYRQSFRMIKKFGTGSNFTLKFRYLKKCVFLRFLRLWGSKLIIIYDKNTHIDECVLSNTHQPLVTRINQKMLWKFMKIVEYTKIDILNFKSAIAPIMIILWLYKYKIRNIGGKFYLFLKFEPILTILVF